MFHFLKSKFSRKATGRCSVYGIGAMAFFLAFAGGAYAAQEIAVELAGVGPVDSGYVLAWGENGAGQITVPNGLSGVKAISAGEFHTVALKGDGSVLAWGLNDSGQTTVSAGLGVVQAIAAGVYHTVALRTNGTVVAWGSNTYGQATVPSGLTSVKAIASGYSHTVALKHDGTLVAWGDNTYGQRSVPASLNGVLVQAIATGAYHTLALTGSGTVVAWGWNSNGQTSVPAGTNAVTAIAAGGYHSLALRSNGTVSAWGRNVEGQTTLPSGLTSVRSIAAGGNHSLAIKTDTSLVAWGDNSTGQLTLPSGLKGLKGAAGGAGHTAVLADGLVDFGNQKLNVAPTPKTFTIKNTGNTVLTISNVLTTTDQFNNFLVDKSGMNASIAPGDQTTVAVSFLPNGVGFRQTKLRIISNDADEGSYDLFLTGTGVYDAEIAVFTGASSDPNDERTSGVGIYNFAATRVGAPATPQTFTVKNAGATDSLSNIKISVAGTDAADFSIDPAALAPLLPNQTGTFTVGFTPHGVGLRTAIIYVDSLDQDERNFAINLQGIGISPEIEVESQAGDMWQSNGVVGWGANQSGQTSIPVGLASNKAVAIGFDHVLALKYDGTVVGWGGNSSGQTSIPADLTDVVSIAAGGYFSVALRADGTVIAWGRNNYGQASLPLGLTGVVAIAAGDNHTIALKNDGTVVAWGWNLFGQTSVPSGLTGVTAISAGYGHTLALKQDGTVVAWGASGSSASNITVPSQLSGVQAISTGGSHCMALKQDGTVVEWGQPIPPMPLGLNGVRAIAAGATYGVALKGDGRIVTWGENYGGQLNFPAGLAGVQSIATGYSTTLAISAPVVNFATQAVQTVSAPKPITIRNSGAADLHVSSVSLVSGDLTDFSLNTGGMLTTLSPTAQTTFSVSFTPTVHGFRQVRVRIVSDDLDEGNYDLMLEAYTPYDAEIAVFTGSSTAPSDERIDAVGTYTFSTTHVALGMATQAFTIKNVGLSDALTDLRSFVKGDHPGDFSITSSPLSPLAPGASRVVTVSFNPKALGVRRAVLCLLSNDEDEGSFEINLSGEGGQPEISVEQPAGTPLEISQVLIYGPTGYEGFNLLAPQLNMPSVQALTSGASHGLILKLDGTVTGWGSDGYGGALIPSNLTDVVAIAAGNGHSLALKRDGTVQGWGRNGNGQADVPAGLSGVKVVAATAYGSLAVKADGTVVAWGDLPANFVPTGLTDVVAIASSIFQTLALKSDGSLVPFGTAVLPASIAGLTGVKAVAVGEKHSLAIKADGTVVAWGWGGEGQTLVPWGLSDVRSISAGADYSLAVKADGTAVAWGGTSQDPTPVPPDVKIHSVAPGGGLALVRAKVDFGSQPLATPSVAKTFTIKNTGPVPLHISNVRIVGAQAGDFSINSLGMLTTIPATNGETILHVTYTPSAYGIAQANLQILNDDSDESIFDIILTGRCSPPAPEISLESPTGEQLESSQLVFWGGSSSDISSVPAPLMTGVRSIAAGGYANAALKYDGTLVAWGYDSYGATNVPNGLTNVQSIAVPASRMVALLEDGSLRGWGDGVYGQNNLPNGPTDFIAIAASYWRTVGLDRAGNISQLGGGGATPISGVTDVRAVALGEDATVILKRDSSVVSWDLINSPTFFVDVKAITCGRYHAAALLNNGTVYAWGRDNAHQIAVPPDLADVQAIAAGGWHTLALKQDGTVVAWGDNQSRQLNVPANLKGVHAIAAGDTHSIALTGAGADYGAVTLASTTTKSFVIKNTGTAVLHISGVEIIDGGEGDFVLSSPGVGSGLVENEQRTVAVTFAPRSKGPKQATLRITSDDADESVFEVFVTGTGGVAPTAVGAIPWQQVEAGAPLTLDLAAYFQDGDGDPLTYVIDANTHPSNVSHFLTGAKLVLGGQTIGASEITVRAIDPDGNTARQTFMVRSAPILPSLWVLTPPALNAQTGLVEETLRVDAWVPLEGFRICVSGLPVGVRLVNATSPEGAVPAWLDVSAFLSAGGSKTVVLTYEVTNSSINFTPVLSIKRTPHFQMDQALQLDDRSILVKFHATPGKRYSIQYSNDLLQWSVCPTTIMAGSDELQWIDRGPPETLFHPATLPHRYYRVSELAP